MAIGALVLFCLMFLFVFVVRSIVQKRTTGDSGLRTGMLRARIGSLEWLAGWLLVAAMVAAVGAPVAELAGWDPFTDNRAVRGAGVVLAAVGIALTFASQLDMGSEWRIGVDASEETRLVSRGAFSVVRNPIFTSLVIAAGGLALMVPNPLGIAGLVLLMVAVELQVRFVEEPYLRMLHGAAYLAYAAQVGRFVPGVGRSVGA